MSYKENKNLIPTIMICCISFCILIFIGTIINNLQKDNVYLQLLVGQNQYIKKQDFIISKLNVDIKQQHKMFDSLNLINKSNKDSLLLYKKQVLNYKYIKYTTKKDTL